MIEEKKTIPAQGVQCYLGEIWGEPIDHSQDKNASACQMNDTKLEAENNQLKARLAELETELAACREQMEEARRANTSGNGDTEGFFEAYPICKLIYGLHHAGKSRDEIRAELTAKGYSNAQTGFLTQGDTLARSDKTIKQSVLRSKKDAKCS